MPEVAVLILELSSKTVNAIKNTPVSGGYPNTGVQFTAVPWNELPAALLGSGALIA